MKTISVNVDNGGAFIDLDYDDSFDMNVETIKNDVLECIYDQFVVGSLAWEMEGKLVKFAVEDDNFTYEVA